MGEFFLLLALEVAGLAAIWFLLKARISRALELDGLLAEARKELRLLTIEINETTERNITLVEDRLGALQELLSEADRRIGVMKRETARREGEVELYSRLGKKTPRADPPPRSPPRESPRPPGPELFPGTAPEAEKEPRRPEDSPDTPGAGDRPGSLQGDPLSLIPASSRPRPEILARRESVIPPKSLRERALELHRGGFSAELIAARLGATVSEIELLVSLEDGRAGLGGAEEAGSAGEGAP